MWLIVMEWIGVALFCLFIILQILVPAFKGTLLFPWFRKQRVLEKELAIVKQHKEEDHIKDVIKEEKTTPYTPIFGIKPKRKK